MDDLGWKTHHFWETSHISTKTHDLPGNHRKRHAELKFHEGEGWGSLHENLE